MKPLVFVALLLPALAAAGPVYKWTDEKGRVHFSDKPVGSAQKLDIRLPGSLPGTAPPPAEETVENNESARAKACQQKKDQLATYQNAAVVKEVDSLGNEKEFSEEQKQQLIARTQQQITQYCGAQTAREGGE